MSTRYHIQVDGEAEPRGPLPSFAVRRLIVNGEVTGGTPACQEGDTEWLTLDDYWEAIHAEAPPTRRHPVPVIYAAPPTPLATEHPAMRPPVPLPIWRIVYGVCFIVSSFTAFAWALLAAISVVKAPVGDSVVFFISCLIVGVIYLGIGILFTTNRPARR